MPKPMTLDKPCEVCGKNEWWDNTQSKKSPKAPDYVCANKECAGKDGYKSGRWLPKGNAKSVATGGSNPQGGRLTPDDTTPDEQGQRVFTWEAFCYTYAVLTRKVVEAMEKAKLPVEPSAVQAGVATLLIQGEKAHIPLLHPRKVEVIEKPKPKEKPMPEGFEDFERVEDEGAPW